MKIARQPFIRPVYFPKLVKYKNFRPETTKKSKKNVNKRSYIKKKPKNPRFASLETLTLPISKFQAEIYKKKK
jgi:hypothetical protein